MCVGQRACTTNRLDLRRDSRRILTHSVVLNRCAVRIKAFPLYIVDIEFLDFRRIDQLDVIYVQRVACVQTVVGTEVRVVRCREDDIHLLRCTVVHVVDRHADIRPLAVLRALTPHTFGYLRCFLVRTALVSIERLTNV